MAAAKSSFPICECSIAERCPGGGTGRCAAAGDGWQSLPLDLADLANTDENARCSSMAVPVQVPARLWLPGSTIGNRPHAASRTQSYGIKFQAMKCNRHRRTRGAGEETSRVVGRNRYTYIDTGAMSGRSRCGRREPTIILRRYKWRACHLRNIELRPERRVL